MDRRDAHHPYGLSHPYQARGRTWLSCRRHRLRTSPGPASRARRRPARPRVPAVGASASRPAPGLPSCRRPSRADPADRKTTGVKPGNPREARDRQPGENDFARLPVPQTAQIGSPGDWNPCHAGTRRPSRRRSPPFPPSRPHFGHDLAIPIGNCPDLRLCQVRKAVTPARSSARGRDCLPSGRERHGASARHTAALGGVGGQARQHGAHCPAARHRRRRDGRQARAPAAAGCGTTAVADLGTA